MLNKVIHTGIEFIIIAVALLWLVSYSYYFFRSVCCHERKLDKESSSQDCLCAGHWAAHPLQSMASDVPSATSVISSWITKAF